MLVNFDGFRCGAACKNIIHKLIIHVLFNQKKSLFCFQNSLIIL